MSDLSLFTEFCLWFLTVWQYCNRGGRWDNWVVFGHRLADWGFIIKILRVTELTQYIAYVQLPIILLTAGEECIERPERPQQVRSRLTFWAPQRSEVTDTTTAAYQSEEDISSAGLTKGTP